MKLFGYEVKIQKIKKELPKKHKVSDKKLIDMAIDKYLKTETVIMGICGDVERGLVIGFKELFIDQSGRRCVRFMTNNEEYPFIYYTEDQILNK